MKRLFALLSLALFWPGVTVAQYALQYGAATAVSENQIIVGEGRNLLLPGTVFVYSMDNDGMWSQTQLLSPGGESARGFGRALSAHGDLLAVGAPLAQEVYVYRKDESGTWQPEHVLAGDQEGYGAAVAVYGNQVLVGAPGGREASGLAYITRRGEDGTWTQGEVLDVEESEAGDGLGLMVALGNGYAVVGAPNASDRSGAAYVFKSENGAWVSQGAVPQAGAEPGSRFGSTAVFIGDQLAIALPGGPTGVGSVSVFALDEEGEWTLDRQLAPFDGQRNQAFGSALAAADEHLLVGAPQFEQRQGTVYSFDLATSAAHKLSPANLQFRSSYGTSVAAAGALAVVGATGHDNFEGAVFPARVVAGQWHVDAAVFNADSEIASITGERIECREGEADMFPCSEVDMISFMTRGEIGARRGIQVNDVWGWEDPETGIEYALVGRTDGTSFVELSDPANPRYLGDLPKTATANQSLWRDIKVYKDHAFIVADGAGAHHVQIFDLTQLRDVAEPQTFTETALYKGVYSSHNIIINEETGYAFAVGSGSGGESCGGALHMINIQDPVNPTFAGCFADSRTGRRGSGATHDAQCVSYRGPDADFAGHEICLSSNGTALSIADVTDKSNPVALSVAEYPNVAYAHQGWLSEDHRYFYLNDEGDEASGVTEFTRTLIFDLSDLEDPQLVNEYMGPTSAIDHNLYIRDNIMYQTNYVEGLRLVDITDPENPVEVGHFDTVPYGPNDNSPVLGAWSNYPYFKSGIIVVTSGREGVFILKKRTVDI